MTVIQAENISKAYQLGEIGTGTISRDIERWWAKLRGKEDPFLRIGETNDRTSKGESDIVWSLKDLNFEIQQGDAVGIIGRNGAGKSTLLKLLSRITAPTTGSIKVKGRVASLLEVGTGFHPELTGRENIFLNGAILGMRKKEITRKFDEIVDFAGVERYVDTPVKRYSSGMYVRLAFAVAAYLESEILIVDEVLAVGDAEFQKKCLGKMGDISKGQGRTVLFVSHNMASMLSFCNKGILLNKGVLEFQGNMQLTIKEYLQIFTQTTRKIGYSFEEAPGNNLAKFLFAEVKSNGFKKTVDFFEEGEALEFDFIFHNLKEGEVELDITFHLVDEMGQLVFVGSTGLTGHSKKFLKGEVYARCIIPENLLQEGSYTITRLLLVQDKGVINYEIANILQFEIIPQQKEIYGWKGAKEGVVKPKLEWQFLK